MKRTNLFIAAVAIGLAACNKQPDGGLKQIEIAETGESVTVTTDQIFSSYRIVPLETTDSSLVGGFINIVVTDSNIYWASPQEAFKFTADGRFVSKINRAGRSGQEYISIEDLQIDSDGNALIFSMISNAIYKYDWNGHFLGKTEIKPFAAVNSIAFRFLPADNQTFWLYVGNYGQDFYNCVINVDAEGNILSKSLPYSTNRKGYFQIMEDRTNFSRYQDNSYCFQIFNDTVYLADNDGVFRPTYHIDFKSNAVPDGYYNRPHELMEFMNNFKQTGCASGVEMFMETPNNYWVGYYKGSTRCRALVPKDGGPALCFENIADANLLKNFVLAGSKKRICPQSDGTIAITAQPFKIMEYANANLSKEDAAAVAKAISYSDEDQNPVLLIGKLK